MVALVNAGASAININVIRGEQSFFTRDISIGGNAYTEALQKELHLSHDDGRAAEARRAGGAASTSSRPGPSSGRSPTTCCSKSRRRSTSSAAPPAPTTSTALVLSGGTSRIDGFAEMLGERFDAEVEMFNPFKRSRFRRDEFGVPAAA